MRALATCAGGALSPAVIAARWQLIAFAAPLLGVLCSISWQRPVPKIRVHGEPDSQRCFEGERARRAGGATGAALDPGAEESGAAGAVELTVPSIGDMHLEVLASDSRHGKTL